MEEIRVVQWGLGSMGSGSARMVMQKKGMELVGAIAQTPAKAGRDVGELLGLEKTGVLVSGDPVEVIRRTRPHVVLLSTGSFIKDVFPQIKTVVENRCHCITIAEEMAYPRLQDPVLSGQIDRAARENGVTVLGTGINPGFVLDTLIIVLTGACMDIKKIKASRINDLSPYGPTVMRTQGVGTTPGEFEKGIEDGSIVGHIGFPESIHLIAGALGWEVEKIVQCREPIISAVYRETPHVKVHPGMVAGCNHSAKGYVNGEAVIELQHPQQIHPGSEGVETGDYISIEGTPDIKMEIKPEIPGGIGTIALTVNMIPRVVNAAPGLKTMKDLPLPASVMGDIKGLIEAGTV